MTDQKDRGQQGQSIIIVALAFVALMLFVAIAVDMSAAYVQRRTAQNAADAAAFAGGRELVQQRNTKKFPKDSNAATVKEEMNDFAERNGIADTDGTAGNSTNANVEGYYLDRAGNRLGSPPNPIVSGHIPQDAFGIEAVTHIEAFTFFGGIMGLDGLPLTADAAVSVGVPPCGVTCVVPVATYWYTDVREFETSQDPDTWQVWGPDGSIPPFTCYNIWNGEGPGNFGWLNWSRQEIYCSTGDCSAECLAYNLTPGQCIGYLAIGEWVAGTTGRINSRQVQTQLNRYIDEHLSFTVPLYFQQDGTGGCGASYQIAGFARMQLIGYKLPQGAHYDPWVPEEYLSLCTPIGAAPGEEPNDGTRLTAYFLDFIDESSLPGDCEGYGTITTPRMIK
jgi:type II secretory pathway pseudopilin PulG